MLDEYEKCTTAAPSPEVVYNELQKHLEGGHEVVLFRGIRKASRGGWACYEAALTRLTAEERSRIHIFYTMEYAVVRLHSALQTCFNFLSIAQSC